MKTFTTPKTKTNFIYEYIERLPRLRLETLQYLTEWTKLIFYPILDQLFDIRHVIDMTHIQQLQQNDKVWKISCDIYNLMHRIAPTQF